MLKLQAQSSRALGNALNIASRCLAKKNTISILDNVLLSQKNGNFVFTTATTDSQLTIAAPLSVISGTFTSPMALPVNGMVSFLSTLPECVVNLTINDDKSLVLDYCFGSGDKVKTGKVSLTYLDGGEFPLIPGLSDGVTRITLPSDMFLGAIEQAKVFSARDELRMVLNTLCIDIAEDASECYFVATNGKLIIKQTHRPDHPLMQAGNPRPIVIYNGYFRAISAFASCESIDIETDGQSIRLSSGDIEFVCKAVEGKYPNYNAVIPKGNPYYITFDKKELCDAIKRVSIFGNTEMGMVQLQFEGMFINVSARDMEFSTESSEQVFVGDSKCDTGFSIGVNATQITNSLMAIDADTIRMQLSDPSRPCVCTADEASPSVLTLCMPMRLQ